MTEPGGPDRRGRHSAGDGTGSYGAMPRGAGGFPPAATWNTPTGGFGPGPVRGSVPDLGPGDADVPARPRVEPWADAGAATGGLRRESGLLGRRHDHNGSPAGPEWRSLGSGEPPFYPQASHDAGGDDGPGLPRRPDGGHRPDNSHPSAPLPPLPPRPTGVWDRLPPRTTGAEDDATVAHPIDPNELDPNELDPRDPHARNDDRESAETDTDVDAWDDRTGGLEVIGAHVEDDAPRRRWGRRRRSYEEDGHDTPVNSLRPDRRDTDTRRLDEVHPDDDRHVHGGAIPVAPYRRPRGRRPLAVLLSLLVLGGLVVGIVLGVQALLGLTPAEDYAGEGTGSVEIRVQEGDTLSDIARTLVDADVIASTRPFVNAADDRPEATGIQPGVYGLRAQMSGQSALDLLLTDASRLLSRVTIPEGFTVERTLERIADETGLSIEELQAAAADTVALGLPTYANGQLEGYLFPATYDLEPDDTATDILRRMVQQFTSVAATLELEQRAAAVGRSPAQVVIVASMIQSETRLDDDRPDVGQVIYNRLDQEIPLGIDAALAFGLDKSGADLTVTDLQTDGPYNTRTRPGLPPTPISSPGEASLEAALAPSSGDLLYYVLESADGEHFFTSDYAEFQAARQRCAEAGLGCGG